MVGEAIWADTSAIERPLFRSNLARDLVIKSASCADEKMGTESCRGFVALFFLFLIDRERKF